MRGLRIFFAVVVLVALPACSLSTSAGPAPSSTSPPSTKGSGPTIGTDPKATLGEAEIQGSEFRLFTGKVWVGFTAPNGYAVSRAKQEDVKLVGLTSSSDSKTNLMFSHLSSATTLPSADSVAATLRTKQFTNIEARHDIQNLGDFKAVAAQATIQTGYVAIVVIADFEGYLWSATINAPDAATADELLKTVRALKPVNAGSRTSPSTAASRHVGPLKATVSGQTYTVNVNGAKIVMRMPDGFVPSKPSAEGLLGFEDQQNSGRNVSFYIDRKGFTTDPTQILAKMREDGGMKDIEHMKTVPEVQKVAGYPAGAILVKSTNGTISRIYIVNVDGVMIQLVVNSGKAETEIPALLQVVEDATS